MKKKDITELKMPLTRVDYLRLREALEHDQIQRTDLTDEMRSQLDIHWAKDNEKEYDRLYKLGVFGEFD